MGVIHGGGSGGVVLLELLPTVVCWVLMHEELDFFLYSLVSEFV